MADQVLLMEARMKDLISGELNKVEKNLKDVDKGAKKSFGSAQKSANSFGNTLKGFVGAQAIIGGVRTAWRMMSGTIKDSLALYGVQIQAETQLQQALGFTSEALLTQASNLQQLTTFGDEETIQAQALIAMFVKEENQIRKVIPLVQDFAAAKGLKLAVAADLVSKTLGSSTNALTRYGIQVTGAVGSEERLATMTNSLSKAFKGQAEAIAKTGTGPLKQYNMAVDDLKEDMGGLILLGIKPIAGALRKYVIPAVREATQALTKFFETSNETRSQLEILDDSITSLESEYKSLGAAIQDAAGEEVNYVNYIGVAESGHKSLTEALKKREELEVEIAKKKKEREKLSPTPGVTPGDTTAAPDGETPLEIARKNNLAAEELALEHGFKMQTMSIEQGQQLTELFETDEGKRLEKLQECKDKEDKIRQEANDKMLEIEKLNYEQSMAVMNQYVNTMDAVFGAIISMSNKNKEELKPILYAQAIMRAAMSTVTAVQAAWETAGSNFVVGGVLSALAVVENAALLAGQLSAISSAATGASFVADRPQALMVGDNPTQAEQVTVTPLGSRNAVENQGGGGSTYNVTVYAQTSNDIYNALRDLERDSKIQTVTAGR